MPFFSFNSYCILTSVGGRAEVMSKGREEECICHLFQRLGVLLGIGNETLLLDRIPFIPLLPADGDL
jgi:hypothetical protein